MSTRAFFPTLIYHAPLMRSRSNAFNRELLHESRLIRDNDPYGQRWSRKNYPGGYTSYGSLDKLHRLSSTFAELERKLIRHALRYANDLELDLTDRKLVMTDCWVNIMPRGTAHGLHLHPLSTLSGTYYVKTPRGTPGLKFEDPRLSKFMAAPPRRANCSEEKRFHVTYPATAGNVTLFESWLRHEVAANPVAGERVSISFNFHWV